MTPGHPSQPGPGPAACTHERPQDPLPSRLSLSPSSGSRCQTPRSPAPVSTRLPSGSPHTFTLSRERSPPSLLRTGVHVPGTSLLTSEDLADPLTAVVTAHVGPRPATLPAPQRLHASVASSGDLHTPNHSKTNSQPLPRSPPPARLSTPAPGRLSPTTDPISYDPAGLSQHLAQAPQGVTTITLKMPATSWPFPAPLESPGRTPHLGKLTPHSLHVPAPNQLNTEHHHSGLTLALYGSSQKYTKK